MKMTVTDQMKIIDGKIVENQAQYDLDRLAAKIYLHCLLINWTRMYIWQVKSGS